MSTITKATRSNGRAPHSEAAIGSGVRLNGAGQDNRPPQPVTREQVEARAYEIFLSRNGGSGDAASDWLRAERELKGGVAGAPASPEMPRKQRSRAEALLEGDGE